MIRALVIKPKRLHAKHRGKRVPDFLQGVNRDRLYRRRRRRIDSVAEAAAAAVAAPCGRRGAPCFFHCEVRRRRRRTASVRRRSRSLSLSLSLSVPPGARRHDADPTDRRRRRRSLSLSLSFFGRHGVRQPSQQREEDAADDSDDDSDDDDDDDDVGGRERPGRRRPMAGRGGRSRDQSMVGSADRTATPRPLLRRRHGLMTSSTALGDVITAGT